MMIWFFLFQFTLPCGERRPLMFFRYKLIIVSIHAPVRGATMLTTSARTQKLFQFTLPCGERRPTCQHPTLQHRFNSRSRAGSDKCLSVHVFSPLMFQFTLPCGERHPSDTVDYLQSNVSIHAPVRGATQSEIHDRFHTRSFNSRSRAGSDKRGPWIPDFLIVVSIHAPVRGATAYYVNIINVFFCFNSRSRAGSDATF